MRPSLLLIAAYRHEKSLETPNESAHKMHRNVWRTNDGVDTLRMKYTEEFV